VYDIPTSARDCKHGHLARSCNICDLERELADMKTFGVVEIMVRNERVADFVRERERELAALQAEKEAAFAALERCIETGERSPGVDARLFDGIVRIRSERDEARGQIEALCIALESAACRMSTAIVPQGVPLADLADYLATGAAQASKALAEARNGKG
jgi:hypothetical protein